jgi:hypothetical protein
MALTWHGDIVGWMEAPKVDMFHLYGRWVSAGTAHATRFLVELQNAVSTGEGLEVVLGDRPGTVGGHPDDSNGEIDVLCYPT